MWDKVLISIADQTPGLVVLCFIVWTFLKHDAERDRQNAQRDQHSNEMHAEHMEARKVSRETMESNTKAFNDLTRVFQHQVDALEGVRQIVQDMERRDRK